MNDIVENKTFEQKMKDRVKESIGDLMSDEDLSKIVERGIEEAFFKESKDTSSYHAKTIPPLAKQMVSDIMKDQVNMAVTDYFIKNPDLIKNLIAGVIEDGLGNALLNSLNQKFKQDLYTFQTNIDQRLQNGGL
jgi:hypothetical protein